MSGALRTGNLLDALSAEMHSGCSEAEAAGEAGHSEVDDGEGLARKPGRGSGAAKALVPGKKQGPASGSAEAFGPGDLGHGREGTPPRLHLLGMLGDASDADAALDGDSEGLTPQGDRSRLLGRLPEAPTAVRRPRHRSQHSVLPAALERLARASFEGSFNARRGLRRAGVVAEKLCHSTLRNQATTADLWNSERIRIGEHVHSSNRTQVKGHPNAWTTEGTLQIAFRRLVATTSKKARTTARCLDACSVVAHAYLRKQDQHIAQLKADMLSKPLPWLWIERAWDATPLQVHFGKLTDLIRPMAKILLEGPKHDQQRHRALGTTELRGVQGEERVCRAQPGRPRIPGPESGGHHASVPSGRPGLPRMGCTAAATLHAAIILANKTTSTLWQALEASLPAFSVSELRKLTANVNLVVLSLCGDLDTVNVRCKLQYMDIVVRHNAMARAARAAPAASTPSLGSAGHVGGGDGGATAFARRAGGGHDAAVEHTCSPPSSGSAGHTGGAHGLLAVVDVFCLGHVINRIVSAALRYDQLITKLYATAAILSIPSIHKAHLHALRNLIRDDLRTGFFRGQAPSKKVCRACQGPHGADATSCVSDLSPDGAGGPGAAQRRQRFGEHAPAALEW